MERSVAIVDQSASGHTRNGTIKVNVFDMFGDDTELQEAFPTFDDMVHDIQDEHLHFLEVGESLSHSGLLDAFPSFSDVGEAQQYASMPSLSNDSITSMVSVPSLRTRIAGPSRRIMDAWMEKNAKDPYLKPGDAEALAHLTSLTTRQVQTYMANSRARKPPQNTAISAFNSSGSMASSGSCGSLAALSRIRRGRRTSSTASLHSARTTTSLVLEGTKRYPCTFFPCDKAFTRKSDWKRHETVIHVPQEAWICLPTFPMSKPEEGSAVLECHFCSQTFPAEGTDVIEMVAHLSDNHNYLVCLGKPEEERTFARKDKLKQHLQQVHAQEQPMTRRQAEWVRSVNQEAVFACPFCAAKDLSWQHRLDHVALHLEEASGHDVPSIGETFGETMMDTSMDFSL